jgi:hypothetical protein
VWSAFSWRNDDFTTAFAAFAELSLCRSADAMTDWTLRHFLDGHYGRSILEFVGEHHIRRIRYFKTINCVVGIDASDITDPKGTRRHEDRQAGAQGQREGHEKTLG